MSIILVCGSNTSELLQSVVYDALVRSFGSMGVELVSVAYWRRQLNLGDPLLVVLVDPNEEWQSLIVSTLDIYGSKLMVFGNLSTNLASFLDISLSSFTDVQAKRFDCAPAQANHVSDSDAVVKYCEQKQSSFKVDLSALSRSCTHYDFMAEWNNLGYGAIKADRSIWAVASCAQAPVEAELAHVSAAGEKICSYAVLQDVGSSSLFWFNRQVGPVDSHEWCLVEQYFSHYAHEQNSLCLPFLSEIPMGFESCVTMRLDCDEEVLSSRELFNIYKQHEVPFSLALHTSVLPGGEHDDYVRSVVSSGGSILSHSVSHPVNWGGSYTAALKEALESRQQIIDRFPEIDVKYAVSPFHQNPDYAIRAISDAGYSGCITGIVCNDPEYLIARGGRVPRGNDGFVVHAQQCMLHGECINVEGDPIHSYKTAFDTAKVAGGVFGYLDHPFSSRYQYGWESEGSRGEVHSDFINYIKSSGSVLFLSQQESMNWMLLKNSTQITSLGGGKFLVDFDKSLVERYEPTVEYKGKRYLASCFSGSDAG